MHLTDASLLLVLAAGTSFAADTPSAPPATSAPATSFPATSAPPTAQPTATPPAGSAPAATAAPATASPASQDTMPSAVTGTASYAEFRRLFDASKYAEAIPVAQRIVEQIESRTDIDDSELQIALMNLAATQALGGDPLGAEASYLRVIQIIEEQGKLSSPRLARALAGLANVYYRAKRYDVAAASFERALLQSRRTEGLFNTDQLPLLTNYADALTQLSRYEEALRAQEYALRIAERQYGALDPRVAPVLESTGRWYAKLGLYDVARQKLRRALQIVERAKGENDLALIGPLTGLAETYRRQALDPDEDRRREGDAPEPKKMFETLPLLPGEDSALPSMLAGEGLRALTRASQIVNSHPDATPVMVVDVRTQLGDWYQSRQQDGDALPHYQEAWRIANGLTQGGRPLSDVLFGQPVLLHYMRPSSADRYAGRPPEQVALKNIEVELDVSERGQVVNPHLLSNEGTERMGLDALSAAESARYRPRFVNGQPVATQKVVFRQSFRMLLEQKVEPEPLPPTLGVPPPPPKG